MNPKRLKSYWIGTLVLLLMMMVFGLAAIYSLLIPLIFLFPLSIIAFILTLQKKRVAYFFNLVIGIPYTLFMFAAVVNMLSYIAKYASDPESSIYYSTLGWLRYVFVGLVYLVPFILFLILTWKTKPLFSEKTKPIPKA